MVLNILPSSYYLTFRLLYSILRACSAANTAFVGINSTRQGKGTIISENIVHENTRISTTTVFIGSLWPKLLADGGTGTALKRGRYPTRPVLMMVVPTLFRALSQTQCCTVAKKHGGIAKKCGRISKKCRGIKLFCRGIIAANQFLRAPCKYLHRVA